jgi:hypothetical protein
MLAMRQGKKIEIEERIVRERKKASAMLRTRQGTSLRWRRNVPITLPVLRCLEGVVAEELE